MTTNFTMKKMGHLMAAMTLLTASALPSAQVLAQDYQPQVPAETYSSEVTAETPVYTPVIETPIVDVVTESPVVGEVTETPAVVVPAGADTQVYDYLGENIATLTAIGEAVTSNGKKLSAKTSAENVALVQSAGTLTVTKDDWAKSGDNKEADMTDFYGLNAILLALNKGSQAYVSDTTLTGAAIGAHALFATDSANIYANATRISGRNGHSRGLMATYGGLILANALTIDTKGTDSAALGTGRGGGTISVTNSDLTTSGANSPLLVSTGTLEADQVTGTASASKIAELEGLNTLRIYNSNLTSETTKAASTDPMASAIMVYQSDSGNAQATTSQAARLEVVNSTLESELTSGALFYLTNTAANVIVSDTQLDFDTDEVQLLHVAGNSQADMGVAGGNGADVTFTAIQQTLAGEIEIDTLSSLDFYLLKGSTYTGQMTVSINAAAPAVTDNQLTVNVDETSTWVVTDDTIIAGLNIHKGAKIVDEEGQLVTIEAAGETVVEGESDVTVTVTSSYQEVVTATADNTLETNFVDRTAFDKHFATQTAFNASVQEEIQAETDESQAVDQEVVRKVSQAQRDKELSQPVIYGLCGLLVVLILLALIEIRRHRY